MNNYKFYKSINEKSILIITPKNELKRLYCPFVVLDKNNIRYNVAYVASDNDFRTYYYVNGKYCLYSDYKIMIK